MMSELGNHHQFLKLEKNTGKKWRKKKLYISPKGVSSHQCFWAQHPNRNELSNRTCSSLAEPKAVPVMLYICSLINVRYIFFQGIESEKPTAAC